jgi:hypothetical protein
MATMIRRPRIAPQRRTVHLETFRRRPARELLALGLTYGWYPLPEIECALAELRLECTLAGEPKSLAAEEVIGLRMPFPTAVSVPILSAAPERKSEGVTPMSTNVTRNRRVLKSISSSALIFNQICFIYWARRS